MVDSTIPSRSLKALWSAILIDNEDGTWTLDTLGETGRVRAKPIDDSKEILRRLIRDNGDGTFRLSTNGASTGTALNANQRLVFDTDAGADTYIVYDLASGKLQIFVNGNLEMELGGTSPNIDDVVSWITSLDKFFQFNAAGLTVPKGTNAVVTVQVTNAHADVNTFNNTDSVTVGFQTAGSAAILTPQPVTVTAGEVDVLVTSAVAETITLNLSSPSTPLDVSDMLPITFT